MVEQTRNTLSRLTASAGQPMPRPAMAPATTLTPKEILGIIRRHIRENLTVEHRIHIEIQYRVDLAVGRQTPARRLRMSRLTTTMPTGKAGEYMSIITANPC